MSSTLARRKKYTIAHLNNALVLNLVVAERHIAPWRCYAGYESNIDELMHPRIPRRLYLRHCYFFKSDFEILPIHSLSHIVTIRFILCSCTHATPSGAEIREKSQSAIPKRQSASF
jgi:hypothetical protein